MSEESKQLARRWFDEVWNQKSEAAIDRMFRPEGRAHGLPTEGGRPAGPEDFKTIHRTFLGAFPDIRFVINDVIAEGDRVAVRWTANMTHAGDHLGFPATGSDVTLEGSSFLHLKDGMIFEAWNQMELQGMIQSLKSAAEKAVQA